MDSDTTDGYQREVDPVQRVLRIIGGIALGLVLGAILAGFLLLNVLLLAWGLADTANQPPAGWRQADWLVHRASSLSLLLLPLLPLATALGVVTIGSDPVAARGLRWVALVVGSVTGILVVLDVLALGAAWHLSDLW